MSKYYPDFYLKRRQKHIAYMRVTVAAVVVAVVALGAMAGIYVFKSFIAPRRTDIRPNPSMADDMRRLKEEKKIKSNNPAVDESAEPPATDAKLDTGAIDYAQSFPAISVGLAGLSPGATTNPVNEAVPEPPTTDETAQAPSDTGSPENQAGAIGNMNPTQESGSLSPPPTEAPAKDTSAKPVNSKPADKPVEKPASKPADTKKTEKSEPKKPVKDETKNTSKPAEKDSVKPAAEVKPPAADSGKVEFKVYAGKFLSREDAEKGKKELAGVGFSGTIAYTKAGDYVLLVGTLDDYDSASALKSKLSDSGFGGSFVTRKKK